MVRAVVRQQSRFGKVRQAGRPRHSIELMLLWGQLVGLTPLWICTKSGDRFLALPQIRVLRHTGANIPLGDRRGGEPAHTWSVITQ